jgi:cytoskeletal protein CcmA (bactofilin family)
MSEPKRRFLERASLNGSPGTTVIAAGTVIHGDVRGKGQFVVLGEIHGDGVLDGDLHVAVAAGWFGQVRAHQAIIAGTIDGGLIVDDKLEIGLTAIIRGRVSARSIAIAKGAVVEGELEVTSDAPIVEFVEKRRDP